MRFIMSHLHLQLQGLRLATAEILYYLPDYPDLIQSYIWQEFDRVPDFPELHRFLEFWERHLEGKLHSVKIASVTLVTAQELYYLQHSFDVH
jgi:uncharacterized protein Usg